MRVGYPYEIVDWVLSTAGIGDGSRVLEIGCGTGQLTRQLASRGIRLTAIDLGPTMVEVARSHSETRGVEFHATSFEDFEAADGSFDLIVSASAFHWIDPDVAWTKSARLLRTGGWIALLATGETYDDPLGSALLDLWIRLSSDGGAWATDEKRAPTLVQTIATTGLFEAAIEHHYRERRTIAPSVVRGLEHTRSTTLAYDEARREQFSRELDGLLKGLKRVGLLQETPATMARVAS
jgi:ubiquinone/menaquinone biosynthesis C-methylase UbiE